MQKLALTVLSTALAMILSAPQALSAPDQSISPTGRSAKQRVAASQHKRTLTFSEIGDDYSALKDYLQKEYGLSYALDVSYMPQYGAPSGKGTAFQTIVSPSIIWEMFNTPYGNATLNAAYNMVRYSGANGSKIGNRIGVVTGINDYASQSNSFDELYISYQFPARMSWLSVALGQFPLYNFDGTAYDSNQQENFINYALAQNASSTYPTASMGGYVQISPNSEWSFALGGQDAHNIDGNGISSSHLFKKHAHYTTFVSASYTPTIKNLGSGQYSVMLYNQPWVDVQKQTTNGWSLNASQNLGEKWALFARANGVSGSTATIKRSYVLGAVYNNPLNRNPLDQIGLAAAYNRLSQKAVGTRLSHRAETVLEAYWAWGVSKWATITPDIQYYINPALNAKSDNAAVFSIRASVFF